VFLNYKQLVQHAIPSLVVKTMEQYVILTLDSCVITTTSFDLWMSRYGHDTFALVINFINSLWVPCHVTVALFETIDTSRVVMAMQVKDFLSLYNLLNKLITYMQDEGGNLSTFTQTLTLVVSYPPLGLVVLWQGLCFGHAFNKTCQYTCNDTKVSIDFKEVNLKVTQFILQKKFTWTKKSSKGRIEWHRACLDVGFSHRKLKTLVKIRFATKVIMFQETLEYHNAINLSYGR
jgi:hypothetical protein